jgi:hypothetical protein
MTLPCTTCTVRHRLSVPLPATTDCTASTALTVTASAIRTCGRRSPWLSWPAPLTSTRRSINSMQQRWKLSTLLPDDRHRQTRKLTISNLGSASNLKAVRVALQRQRSAKLTGAGPCEAKVTSPGPIGRHRDAVGTPGARAAAWRFCLLGSLGVFGRPC